MSGGVDRPSAVAIARFLAKTGADIKEFEADAGNRQRWALEEAVGFLSAEPANVRGAFNAAQEGCAHAFRGYFVETRPEAWLCAAVAELLKGSVE
jgi:hypothetical protein